jgi:hypothetical protein
MSKVGRAGLTIRPLKGEGEVAAMLTLLRDHEKVDATLAEIQGRADTANALIDQANAAEHRMNIRAEELTQLNEAALQREAALADGEAKLQRDRADLTAHAERLAEEVTAFVNRRDVADAAGKEREKTLAAAQKTLDAKLFKVEKQDANSSAALTAAMAAQAEAEKLRDHYRAKLSAALALE